MGSGLMTLSDVQTKLREKVQSAMMDLIPQEKWDEFIKQAWTNLTQPRRQTDSYGKETGKSLPPEIVVMLETEVRAQLKKKIDGWAEAWRSSPEADSAASEALGHATRIAATTFMQTVSHDIAMEAMRALQSSPGCVRCPACSSVGTKGNNCRVCGVWISA